MANEIKVIWPKIISNNSFYPPLISWIDLGNGTVFRILAYSTNNQKHMKKGLFIAIERVGSFWFGIDRAIHWQYASEKLNIPESDARAMADWINSQLGYGVDQQGVYNAAYINSIHQLSFIDESTSITLKPEIMND